MKLHDVSNKSLGIAVPHICLHMYKFACLLTASAWQSGNQASAWRQHLGLTLLLITPEAYNILTCNHHIQSPEYYSLVRTVMSSVIHSIRPPIPHSILLSVAAKQAGVAATLHLGTTPVLCISNYETGKQRHYQVSQSASLNKKCPN